MPKKIRYLVNEQRGERFVRAWKEGRSEIVVQVWNRSDPTGEPDGDWGMPSALGVETSVRQALLQTPSQA